ncbi:hypothetical protein ABZ759_05445 [Streptomyces sp. NPDC047860]|uniref:hypothetical protein n=1 Tax=Streptomyces sp. NPDC047860 TaxID=3155743 RepID=UPI0033F983CC
MRTNGGGADITTTNNVGTAEQQQADTADLAETVRRAKCDEASPQNVFDALSEPASTANVRKNQAS